MIISINIDTELNDGLSDHAKDFIRDTLDPIYHNELGQVFVIREVMDKQDEYSKLSKGHLTVNDVLCLQKGLESGITHIQI